jgi:hypothetical protein
MRSLLAVTWTVLLVGLASAQTSAYQAATILSIQPKDSSSRVHKTTDAPPPSSEADYDVKVRIGNKDYVGRYRHASDYVPSNWEVGKTVEGRVGKHKHRIYLKDLAGKEVALPIVQRGPANPSSK